MQKYWERDKNAPERDYWETGDKEFPYEDSLSIFTWITTEKGKHVRLRPKELFSREECITLYNAYGRLQQRVDTNKRKYPKNSKGYYDDEDGNLYWFDIDGDFRVNYVNAIIITPDEE